MVIFAGFYIFVFIFLYFFISGNFERKLAISSYPFIFYILFLVVYITSYLYNVNNLGDKGVNHILLYMISFCIYYFCFYLALDYLGKDYVQKIMYFGLIILALVGTIEILVFFSYGFSMYQSFLNHGNNVGIYAGVFPRMRSLFNEPSHLAIFVISSSVFVWDLGFRARFIVIYILFWTFSTSAAFGLLGAIFVYNFYKSFVNKRFIYKLNLLLLIVVPVFLFAALAQFPLFSKLLNLTSDSNSSGSVRKLAVIDSLKYLDNSPLIGLGPTFYYNYSETGLFNLYLQLYIEAGFFGLILYLLFYFYHVKAALLKPIYFIAFFALFFQYIGMNHFYIPGVWIMLAYIHYDSLLSKKIPLKFH